MFRGWACWLLGALILLASPIFALATTHIEVILDASASMWKPMKGGGYRITAAKDVLNTFVNMVVDSEDDQVHIGLRVFGSTLAATADGACEDTQLVVAVQGIDRPAFRQALADVMPFGAAPIACSLLAALDDFPATATARHIVLIIDGDDSCGGDLRATAAAVQELGVDLHIVGLAGAENTLRDLVATVPTSTGSNTRALALAVGKAIIGKVELSTEPWPVDLCLSPDEGEIDSPLIDLVSTIHQGVTDLAANSAPSRDFCYRPDLAPGLYTVLVDHPGLGTIQLCNLDVVAGGDNRFTFSLSPPAAVSLGVTPQEAMAGEPLTVGYSGAPPGTGWITVVPSSAPDQLLLHREVASGTSGEVWLDAPEQVGEFEARYHIALTPPGPGSEGSPGVTRVIGRTAFSSYAVPVKLELPRKLATGALTEVSWLGPANHGDLLAIVDPEAPEFLLDCIPVAWGNPLPLIAPLVPCAYEVRYLSGGARRALGKRSLKVVQPLAKIMASEEVVAGAPLAIHFWGPDEPHDYLTIVPAGAGRGEYLIWSLANTGSPLSMEAPQDPGSYEIRYVRGHGGRNLASVPLEVVAMTITVTGPGEAARGSRCPVSWSGPNALDDLIVIAPEGAPAKTYLDWCFAAAGSPLTLAAPDIRGRYELRYLTAAGTQILATTPLIVK